MWYGRIAIILAALGIMDTVQIVTNVGEACGAPQYIFGYLIDCGVVTSSKYGSFLGISIGYFGLLFYASIFLGILFVKELDITSNDKLTLYITLTPVLAFLFSIYLVIIQLFVLELVCLYCMGSAATSTLLFVVLSIPKLLNLQKQM